MKDYRDQDDFYVCEAEQFEGVRYIFELNKCLFSAECSKMAWAKCCKYSAQGQEDLLENACNHCMISGKHGKKMEECEKRIEELACSGELQNYVKVTKETQKDREEYRLWQDQQAEQDREWQDKQAQQAAAKQVYRKPATQQVPAPRANAGKATSSMGSRGGRPLGSVASTPVSSAPLLPNLDLRDSRKRVHYSSSDEEDLPKIKLTRNDKIQVRQNEIKKYIENNEVMRMTFRQAEILNDSLRRAKAAAEANQRLCRSTIEVCEAHARQFGNEAKVISAASKILQEIVTEAVNA